MQSVIARGLFGRGGVDLLRAVESLFGQGGQMLWRALPRRKPLAVAAALVVSVMLHVGLVAWLSSAFLLGRASATRAADARLHVGLRVAPSGVGADPAAPLDAGTGVPVQAQASAKAAPVSEVLPHDPAIAEWVHSGRRREIDSPFLNPKEVDRSAYPLSSPDLSALQVVQSYSGTPIRLRLFVTAKGEVVDVKILHAVEVDEEAATLLAQIWEHIGFVPARRRGADVPSYLDVEFQLTDRIGEPVVR